MRASSLNHPAKVYPVRVGLDGGVIAVPSIALNGLITEPSFVSKVIVTLTRDDALDVVLDDELLELETRDVVGDDELIEDDDGGLDPELISTTLNRDTSRTDKKTKINIFLFDFFLGLVSIKFSYLTLIFFDCQK